MTSSEECGLAGRYIRSMLRLTKLQHYIRYVVLRKVIDELPTEKAEMGT